MSPLSLFRLYINPTPVYLDLSSVVCQLVIINQVIGNLFLFSFTEVNDFDLNHSLTLNVGEAKSLTTPASASVALRKSSAEDLTDGLDLDHIDLFADLTSTSYSGIMRCNCFYFLVHLEADLQRVSICQHYIL